MKELNIDLEMLCIALENHTKDTEFHLDLNTGELLMKHQDSDDFAQISAQIAAEPTRYEQVNPIASFEGYRIMQEFIETLYEGRARENLQKAIQGPKPFRRYKDTLAQYPKMREQWHAFHDKALTEKAAEWALSKGVVARWIVKPPEPAKTEGEETPAAEGEDKA